MCGPSGRKIGRLADSLLVVREDVQEDLGVVLSSDGVVPNFSLISNPVGIMYVRRRTA